jgi:hypothetical protein
MYLERDADVRLRVTRACAAAAADISSESTLASLPYYDASFSFARRCHLYPAGTPDDSTVAEPHRLARAREAFPGRPFSSGTPQLATLRQGSVGDGFLLSAIAALARASTGAGDVETDILDRLFAHVDERWGVYGVVLFIRGHWTWVIVDDVVPVRSDGTALYCHCRTELWPMVLEKAVAKAYGSWDALDGGIEAEALTDLTGLPARQIPSAACETPADLHTLLRRSMVVAVSAADPKGALLSSAGYAVLGVHVCEKGDSFVRLACAVRPDDVSGDWNGRFGAGSDSWRHAPIAATELQVDLITGVSSAKRVGADGGFWMLFADFRQNFVELAVVGLHRAQSLRHLAVTPATGDGVHAQIDLPATSYAVSIVVAVFQLLPTNHAAAKTHSFAPVCIRAAAANEAKAWTAHSAEAREATLTIPSAVGPRGLTIDVSLSEHAVVKISLQSDTVDPPANEATAKVMCGSDQRAVALVADEHVRDRATAAKPVLPSPGNTAVLMHRSVSPFGPTMGVSDGLDNARRAVTLAAAAVEERCGVAAAPLLDRGCVSMHGSQSRRLRECHPTSSCFGSPDAATPFTLRCGPGQDGPHIARVACFNALSTQPWCDEVLRRTIPVATERWGVYGVVLFIHGRWTWVIVDDVVPTRSDGSAQYTDSDSALWPMVLEKALAKAYGSWAALSSVGPAELLMAVTGSLCVHVVAPIPAKALHCVITEGHAAVVTATTADGGLSPGALYAVRRCRHHAADGQWFVEIQAPPLAGPWVGPYCSSSALWVQHPEHYRFIQPTFDDPAASWLTEEDFMTHFASTEILLHPLHYSLHVVGLGGEAPTERHADNEWRCAVAYQPFTDQSLIEATLHHDEMGVESIATSRIHIGLPSGSSAEGLQVHRSVALPAQDVLLTASAGDGSGLVVTFPRFVEGSLASPSEQTYLVAPRQPYQLYVCLRHGSGTLTLTETTGDQHVHVVGEHSPRRKRRVVPTATLDRVLESGLALSFDGATKPFTQCAADAFKHSDPWNRNRLDLRSAEAALGALVMQSDVGIAFRELLAAHAADGHVDVRTFTACAREALENRGRVHGGGNV